MAGCVSVNLRKNCAHVVASNSFGSVTSSLAQVVIEDYLGLIQATYHPVSGQITLNWSGGVLQETTNLLNTGTSWTDVPGTPSTSYIFTPASGPPRFFRLRP